MAPESAFDSLLSVALFFCPPGLVVLSLRSLGNRFRGDQILLSPGGGFLQFLLALLEPDLFNKNLRRVRSIA